LEEEYDEDFDEFENLLINDLGIAPPKAKVVVFILSNGKATVRQICSKLKLHQPQVSVLCNRMVDTGILEVSFEKMTTGRGRKANVYRLAASPQATMNKLLSPIVERLRRQEKAIQQAILKARHLGSQQG
jgi:predicted transcriptional regulator